MAIINNSALISDFPSRYYFYQNVIPTGTKKSQSDVIMVKNINNELIKCRRYDIKIFTGQ